MIEIKSRFIDINGVVYEFTGVEGIGSTYVKHTLKNTKTGKRKQFSDIGLKDLFKKYDVKFV